ncbi:MAG: class I SAM-dependent methyltransferase [Candidatus Thorarchaeota archaeon]
MMAHIMGYRYRQEYLREIAALIPPEAAMVLDAGCGVGALTALVNQQLTSTRIVELDLSRYMLTHQMKEVSEQSVSLVQALMPRFPLRSNTFDAVLTVQSLSEVLCFSGRDVLSRTIEEIGTLLREGGAFIIMDHQNPGDELVNVNLNEQMLLQLERFQNSFEYRPFSFVDLDDGWIRISIRDFYEFITKVWAFDTPLEQEEMQETHTPFTGGEFAAILKAYGFTIDLVSGIVPIEDYFKRYKIKIKPKRGLPQRFFIVKATK